MNQEILRKNEITFKGSFLTLVGPKLEVGQQALNFSLISTDMQEVTLDDFKGKELIITTVPSIDTPVCDLQAKRFNDEAKKHPNLEVILVSCDTPFAQARWLKESSCINVRLLSDYKEHFFGKNYGLLIDELKLLTRAVIIIGKDQKIKYVQIVEEVTLQPNYEDVLKHI